VYVLIVCVSFCFLGWVALVALPSPPFLVLFVGGFFPYIIYFSHDNSLVVLSKKNKSHTSSHRAFQLFFVSVRQSRAST
jgi:hypothetical protein